MSCFIGIPVIVSKLSFIGKNASLPTTTVFTPDEEGDYRVSLYASLTTPPPGFGGSFSVSLGFNDEQRNYPVQVVGGNGGLDGVSMTPLDLNSGFIIHFHSAAKPIQISTVFNISAGAPDQTYDLYVTVIKE